ncbi:MBL fold metallo-hydrolase [Candidatus Omnitrophota bacterium]
MILERISVGELAANCYILAEGPGSPAMVIDPGDDESRIRRILDKHKLVPEMVVNTHGHIDHIGCDDKFAVPVYVHEDDAAMLENSCFNLSGLMSLGFTVKSTIKKLKEKDILRLGGLELEVIHTPGHTQGGMCLLMKKPDDKVLFTGDTLFAKGIGRADFPGADPEALISSIKDKLFKLPDDTKIYPGHGASSTIGEEKRENPFLN